MASLANSKHYPDQPMPRTPWMRDGLCQEYPHVNFFPERGDPLGPAKAVCAHCAVRDECQGLRHGREA